MAGPGWGRGLGCAEALPVPSLLQDLYKTAIEFLKLEKIEVGGVRGNILARLVTQIYDEVFELVKVFADCKYDPLDPEDSVSGGPRLEQGRKLQEWGAGGRRGSVCAGGPHASVKDPLNTLHVQQCPDQDPSPRIPPAGVGAPCSAGRRTG